MTWDLGQWRELSRCLPKRRLSDEAVTFVEQTKDPLCVACSGGSDSLALLLLTRLFWPKRTVLLLHYNHRVRAASDEEERQMYTLAQQLRVKIEVGHRPVTSDRSCDTAELLNKRMLSGSENSTTIPSPLKHSFPDSNSKITTRASSDPNDEISNTDPSTAGRVVKPNGTMEDFKKGGADRNINPAFDTASDCFGKNSLSVSSYSPEPSTDIFLNSSKSILPEHAVTDFASRSETQTAHIVSKSIFRNDTPLYATDAALKTNTFDGANETITNRPPTAFLPHPTLLRSDGTVSTPPSEAELRAMRYAFFERMMQLHRANILLLGHHADDRMETILMRLVRGVGLEGLVAPRAVHKVAFYTKVRPLLTLPKNDIRQALAKCKVSFFEDATNNGDDCLRNRIRHRLLPAFDETFPPRWRGGFRRSCQLLSEQRDYLKQHLEQRFKNWDFTKTAFACSCLRALPIVEGRYFFHVWLQRHAVRNLSTQTIDMILSTLQTDRPIILPLDAARRLRISEKTVVLTVTIPKQSPKDVAVAWRSGILFFPNNARLSFKNECYSSEQHRQIASGAFSHNSLVVLDAEKFVVPYTVRFWRNGDRYRPLGAKETVKVKELFVNRKIPIERKHQLPVVCSESGDIAWIPGLPPADDFKLTPQTKRCVFLFYQTDEITYSKENGEGKNA